jgi:hypothetical protein
MNNKCCDKCDSSTSRCPLNRIGRADWSLFQDFCSRYTPKPEPGKIEPLVFHSHSDIVDKINEIIAVVNRSVK